MFSFVNRQAAELDAACRGRRAGAWSQRESRNALRESASGVAQTSEMSENAGQGVHDHQFQRGSVSASGLSPDTVRTR